MNKPVAHGRRIGFDFGESGSVLQPQMHPQYWFHRMPQFLMMISSLKIKDIFTEVQPIYVVIGNPIHLSGSQSAKSISAMEFGIMIKSYFSGPIYMVDERMSTQSAYSQMREIGKSEKDSKSVIDQIAAVTILESALQNEKSGSAVGILI